MVNYPVENNVGLYIEHKKNYIGDYHLIQNINNFLKSRFLFKTILSIFDITEIYKIDQKITTSGSFLKITEPHLNPDNFKKYELCNGYANI